MLSCNLSHINIIVSTLPFFNILQACLFQPDNTTHPFSDFLLFERPESITTFIRFSKLCLSLGTRVKRPPLVSLPRFKSPWLFRCLSYYDHGLVLKKQEFVLWVYFPYLWFCEGERSLIKLWQSHTTQWQFVMHFVCPSPAANNKNSTKTDTDHDLQSHLQIANEVIIKTSNVDESNKTT